MLLARREFLLGSLALPALAAPPQPSILLIVARDVGTWMLGCAGNRDIQTPNIDLLAKEGTRMGANFAYSPLRVAETNTLLAAQGYNCGDGNAQAFLDRQSADKPFLLTLNLKDEGHARQYDEMYAKSTFDNMGREPTKLADIVGSLRKRAAAISAMDAQIPLLLAKLHDRGLRENTLIVFCSTNGALLGRHGLWGDAEASDPPNLYEEVVRVPMIWNWPGRIPVESVRNELVGHYDLLPSLCEATGATPPAGLFGRSYAQLAFGKRLPKKQPWQSLVFGRLRDTEMVRDTRYKLVLRNQGKGPNELYDLAVDPREKVNRFDSPGHISVREQLTRQMAMFDKTPLR